jgi:anti-sigma B factor antagonist
MLMSDESQPRSFQIQSHAAGTKRTLVLSGELDMLVAPDVESAVEHLCDKETAELILDLRNLKFIDSTGLRCILTADELCKQSGFSFAVIPGPRQVQAVFELTGLAERLPFQASAESPSTLQNGLPSRLSEPAHRLNGTSG